MAIASEPDEGERVVQPAGNVLQHIAVDAAGGTRMRTRWLRPTDSKREPWAKLSALCSVQRAACSILTSRTGQAALACHHCWPSQWQTHA